MQSQDLTSENGSEKLFSGWLAKRGPTSAYAWQKRCCILASSSLTYFADEACKDGRGIIKLGPRTRAVCVSSERAPGDAVKHMQARPFAFVVDVDPTSGPKRPLFYFDAEDRATCTAWTENIARAAGNESLANEHASVRAEESESLAHEYALKAAKTFLSDICTRALKSSAQQRKRQSIAMLGEVDVAMKSCFRRLSRMPAGYPTPELPLAKTATVRIATGSNSRENNVIFTSRGASQLVVFFPGDISDFQKDMKVLSQYSLENLHETISGRFPAHDIITIRASRYEHDGTGYATAFYDNFIHIDNSLGAGAYVMAQPLDAARHLSLLLADVDSELASKALTLVAFSKGGIALTSVLDSDPGDTEGLKSRLQAIHYVDVGLPGPGPAYASEATLQTLPAHVHIAFHLTDYIAKPAMGFWKEHVDEVANASRAHGLNSELRLYPGMACLETHFDVLRSFDVPVTLSRPTSLPQADLATVLLQDGSFQATHLAVAAQKHPHLVLHFDVNKTVVLNDTVKMQSIEAVLNIILVEEAWGVASAGGSWKLCPTQERLAAARPEGAVTYLEFLEEQLPGKADKKKREALAALFTEPGRPGEALRPVFFELLAKLQPEGTGPPDPKRLCILPAFYRLLLTLKQQGRTFSVVFRSFGEDLPKLAEEFNIFCEGRNACYPQARFDGSCGTPDLRITTDKVASWFRAEGDYVGLVWGDLDLEAKLKSLNVERPAEALMAMVQEVNNERGSSHSLRCTSGLSAVVTELEGLITKPCGLALKDYWLLWNQKGRSGSAGKLLLCDLFNDATHHIFFDDNIEAAGDDLGIIDVRKSVTNKAMTRSDTLQAAYARRYYVVKVETLAALRDEEWFITQLALKEHNLNLRCKARRQLRRVKTLMKVTLRLKKGDSIPPEAPFLHRTSSPWEDDRDEETKSGKLRPSVRCSVHGRLDEDSEEEKALQE